MTALFSVLRRCALGLVATAAAFVPLQAPAQTEVTVTPVVEKKIGELPAGPLYWRIENFPTLAAAQAAASPTSLATGRHRSRDVRRSARTTDVR